MSKTNYHERLSHKVGDVITYDYDCGAPTKYLSLGEKYLVTEVSKSGECVKVRQYSCATQIPPEVFFDKIRFAPTIKLVLTDDELTAMIRPGAYVVLGPPINTKPIVPDTGVSRAINIINSQRRQNGGPSRFIPEETI